MLDPLLDLKRIRHESLLEKLRRLNHQILVVESLARLHHLHDAGVDRKAAVILHFRLRAVAILLLGLLAHQDSNLVPKQVGLVVAIHEQFVIELQEWLRRLLREQFALDQGNQVHLELVGWNLDHLAELVVAQLRMLIEQQQYAHLIGRH